MDKEIQLHRLNIFLGDLQQSRKFAEHILKKKLHDKETELSKLVHKAFDISLIISYSRPFGRNKNFEGQAKSSLEKYVCIILNKEEIVLHNKVIEKRDTTYAHSDLASRLTRSANDKNKISPLIKIPFPLSKSEIEKLEIMIRTWIKYLKQEISKLKD